MTNWTLERITPKTAESYLAKMDTNRSVMRSRVDSYATEMQNGRWMLTHQGIAFNSNERLIDGQHRLLALIKSGVPSMQMWVYRGTPVTAMISIDSGKSRREHDAMKISGMSYVTMKITAIARTMMSCFAVGENKVGQRLPLEEFAVFVEKHQKAIEFAISRLSGAEKALQNSILAAAVAKAFYHVPETHLDEMCEIIKSGMCSEPKNMAAIRIRTFMLTNSMVRGGGSERAVACRKMLNAIKFFEQGRDCQKIYEASKDEYPLPE